MEQFKHVHEVIFLIQQNDGVWTPQQLVEEVSQLWGTEIQFGACSDQTIMKEDVLDFLLERNKVELNSEGNVCIHSAMAMCDGHKNFKK